MNRILKKNVVLIICFILILSCNDKKSELDKSIENKIVTLKMGAKKIEIPFISKLSKQQTNVRIWSKISSHLILKLGGLNDTTFYRPTVIRCDNDDNFYVLDIADFYVKKFSSDGKHIRNFGGQGKGPGEFISPFRIDVGNKGEVLVSDLNLNKCVIFEGDQISQIQLKLPAVSLSLLDGDKIATLQIQDPIGVSFILSYNIGSDNSTEYENLIKTESLKNETLMMLSFLQGEICRYAGTDLVYVPMYLNFFSIFSSDGEILNTYNTIDKECVNIIEQNSDIRVNFNLLKPYLTAIQPSVLEDKLIIMSYKAQQKLSMPVADYYSLKSGKYLYSVKLESIKEFVSIAFTSDKIYYTNSKSEVNILSYKIMVDE